MRGKRKANIHISPVVPGDAASEGKGLGTIATRMQELSDSLLYHKNLYYNETPEISDEEYDALEAELKSLEAQYPELKADDSPTELVGAQVGELFSPVRHERPMASLAKSYTMEEVGAFLARFPNEKLILMPKFDGTSLSLLYQGGKLVRAATRGDGTLGEDVTDNVHGMKGVSENISETRDVEIRGEVVMSRSDFDSYNSLHPENPLKNPRNAASGTLRAKDRSTCVDRPLTFLAFSYQVLDGSLPTMDVAALKALGFNVERTQEGQGLADVKKYIEDTIIARPGLNYDIDGVVLRVASPKAYDKAGENSHHPRASLAYKMAAELGETSLMGVTWQVGKSGIVSPVAEINPVYLAGTTISRATLHNLSMIEEKGILIGDRIQIRRAGDVIPHVDGVAPGYVRTGSETPITPPTHCPSCGGSLREIGTSRVLQCTNTQGCEAQQSRKLIHFASRAAADIDALGQSWIMRLQEAGKLNRPSDFYRLDKPTLLAQGEGMGERRAEQMLASLEQSKNVGLRKTLIGFAIPLASEGTAKRLCRAGYKSIEEVSAAKQEDLEKIEDVGPMVAASLVEFFSSPEIKQEISDLRSLGVNLDVLPEDAPVKIKVQAGQDAPPLLGKKICVTGKLPSGIDRKAFQGLLEAQGGKAVSSVSKECDYLVCGPDILQKGSSKLTSAKNLGITVLSEDEARNLFR